MEQVRKPAKRTKKLLDRIAITMFALLVLWGAYELLTSKPESERAKNAYEELERTTPPVEERSAPINKRISLKVLDYLSAKAYAGIFIKDGVSATSVLKSYNLGGFLSLGSTYSILSSLKGSMALALYLRDDKPVLLKGAILCKNETDADEQQQAFAAAGKQDNAISLFGVIFHYKRIGKLISLSTDPQDLTLIPLKETKPVARLSSGGIIQSAIGIEGSDILLFGAPSLIGKYLDKRFPAVVEEEKSILTIFKALDLHAINSIAYGLSVVNGRPISKLRAKRVRGEGLSGMISRATTEPKSAKFYPASTLLFASQVIDTPNFLKSVGGFLALTNSTEYKNIGNDISSLLARINLSPVLIARAFSGEASFGIAFDSMLPDIWMVLQVRDEEVLETILSLCSEDGILFRKETKGKEIYGFKKPLFSIPISHGFSYKLMPALFIKDGYLVIASGLAPLQRAFALSEGKMPSLAEEQRFRECVAQAGAGSSFVFARPNDALKAIRPLLVSAGIQVPADIRLEKTFYSIAHRKREMLSVEVGSSLPFPFINYILRPEWIPVSTSVAPIYDRLITMLLKSINWGALRFNYYEQKHIELQMDLRGEEFKMTADIQVRNIVQNSTGFTFLLNPFYRVKSVTVDDAECKFSLFGPKLSIKTPQLIAKDKICVVHIEAEGMPEDLLSLIPSGLLKSFHVFRHSVKTPELIHLGMSSIFYPVSMGLRNDVWTSKTTLLVPKGWCGIANGIPSKEEENGFDRWVYIDDRPDNAIEVFAGPFEYVADVNEDFTAHHFFEPGAVTDKEPLLGCARDAMQFYIEKFGGNYERNPLYVHVKLGPGISHCLSYIVLYTRSATTVAHETAHLWWGSLLKFNPLESCMWYEGAAEYSMLMFTKEKAGEDAFMKGLVRERDWWRKLDIPPIPFRNIRMWSHRRGYLGYMKGVMFFRGLETVLGDEGYCRFLKAFAQKGWEFITPSSIWEVAASINPEVSWYISAMLYGKGSFDLEIQKVKLNDEGVWEITVRSVGINVWKGPLMLKAKTVAGEEVGCETCIDSGNTVTIRFMTNSPITSVILDPENKIPDLVEKNNRLDIAQAKPKEGK